MFTDKVNQILNNTNMNKLNTSIETSRLLLRVLSMKDATDMYEYTSNPLVTKHLSWEPHNNVSQAKFFIQNVLNQIDTNNSEFVYGIELKVDRKLIGALKISNVSYHNKRGEFTSILNPNYQGKGYMGEAWQGLLKFCFVELGLQRVQSLVTEDNIASQKKNDRAGLIYEGRLSSYWVMKDIPKDALIYGITNEIYFRNQMNKDA